MSTLDAIMQSDGVEEEQEDMEQSKKDLESYENDFELPSKMART